MKKLLLAMLFVSLAPTTQAKTLHYMALGGKWFCIETIGGGRGESSRNALVPCSSDNLWDILNRDDQKWVNDGKLRSNSYEYKRARPVKSPCGIMYNPKDGKTYKYQKCVYTYK